MKTPNILTASLVFRLLVLATPAAEQQAELKNLSLSGGLEDGKARLVIEALLNGHQGESKAIFATKIQDSIKIDRDKVTQDALATLDILQGTPAELPLSLAGEGEILRVTGEGLQDWSIRQETNGNRTLVLRPRKTDKPVTQLMVRIVVEREIKDLPSTCTALAFVPAQPALLSGYLRVESSSGIEVQPSAPTGLVPIEPRYLPDTLGGGTKPDEAQVLAFRFQGAAYTLPMKLAFADPDARRVVLSNFQLTGRLHDQKAAFTLTALARVRDPKGGKLDLLSGGIALTALQEQSDGRMRFEQNQFVLSFDHAGEFPVKLNFDAAIQRDQDGTRAWNTLHFRVAPASLQPLVLEGLPAETQFDFAHGARPERQGADFVSYLPADGTVKLAWKEARPEAEGKLFYAAEMLSQISVSPGLVREVALLDCKLMQGQLSRVTLQLRGVGEVTRVQGDQVLAWNLEAGTNGNERRLVVQFNQPQKDHFALQIQAQTPLGTFPQTVDALQLRPEEATRFAGYFRIVNEGAVRLEVTQTPGLSQISPEQFPETDMTRAAFHLGGNQKFVYRFSGPDFGLRIQADQIQPELSVSQVLAYHLEENELDIDAEIELDIREAPLRELLVRVPKTYIVARLNASGVTDYFLREPENQPDAELRLVYGQPVSGRQLIQLRLEHNQTQAATNWALPRVEVTKTKSVRGHVGVSAGPGFRLTAERTQALTEIATAFFPRKVPGIQSAYRLSDSAWQASMRVERLPQTVQADAFHLFSIGEGIAYGSSILDYQVSGAPVSTFRIELSDEYYNVEFSGKDIRNWQKTPAGYVVQLHTPISGAYTLLATYERPFRAQGETLTFTGVRPLDAQPEHGYTLVTSAYQFQLKSVDVSAGLLALEPGEVPPEYRLFFDAPILAAYKYVARPFNLKLALSPLAQGESLSQVVDRASLTTHISKEGQILTDVRYFVKNRGNPNLRLTLPARTQLWSASVNGTPVVPVADGQADLIPLPQRADPNAALILDLKLAAQSPQARRVRITAPMVNAPVMLAEWKIEPDAGQRLAYRAGTPTPVGGMPDASGFAQLTRTLSGTDAARAATLLVGALVLLAVAVGVWRWTAAASGVYKFSPRFFIGMLLGLAALALAFGALSNFGELAQQQRTAPTREIVLVAPIQQAGASLSTEVSNLPERLSLFIYLGYGWPLLLALGLWIYSWLTDSWIYRTACRITGWGALAWASLRLTNSTPAFLWVIVAFLVVQVVIPALRQLWALPVKPEPAPQRVPPQAGAAPATTALLVLSLAAWAWNVGARGVATAEVPGAAASMANSSVLVHPELPLAESVTHDIRVEEQYAMAKTQIRWTARKGQILPVLFGPAVLTHLDYPTNALRLVEVAAAKGKGLLAQAEGSFAIGLTYQLQITKHDAENGFTLPVRYGLVNRVNLTVANLTVDIVSPQAVSIERQTSGSNTVATLILSPGDDAWLGWKPLTRDARREKTLFYAELTQLYAPAAGAIEGVHSVSIRPAQGELNELLFEVPAGLTVSDVLDPGKAAATNSRVSLWRFDPDTRKLRVTLNPPQSRPFVLLVRSQWAAGSLPLQKTVGLLRVDNAESQVGLLGIATGNEVQLESVDADKSSPINLEDFPTDLAPVLTNQIPGLAVRRAFRYADASASAALGVSAVEPDIRVETQDTLSLGEDRTVLAVNASVGITRAGIFRLSFALPPGFDVDAISGSALSHWTELKTGDQRIITLHLTGKTQGQQQFAISLAGPGVKTARAWLTPQLAVREASKQQGTLLLVPEQGLRLQVATREGLTQLDPQKSGIQQKGVLAFRELQTPWRLGLDIEQVDAWIQVNSLQHATVEEAQVKTLVNLQYQIENTGLKLFRALLPTNAENVRFQGDQVADFLVVPGTVTNGLQQWEVKLHRRVLGSYFLQASYQTLTPASASEIIVRGVRALDVNLQRGFVTIQSAGRLQLRVASTPEALQPAEWQSIPRVLQQDLQAAAASFAYRLVDPNFQLPLGLERHEAARLLPARVNSISLTSIVSDEGVMLTRVQLDMLPGDKSLLNLTLPKEARFWFAFVNQEGVWPWRDGERILIPLNQPTRSAKAMPVAFFYSCRVGPPNQRRLDLALLAPQFDLPLENLTWRVSVSDKWQLKKWSGSLQLAQEQTLPQVAAVDLQTYLASEANRQREQTKEAEQLLAAANQALDQGDPQSARRSFQAAYGLSTHDAAFNEDARVQLHNIKLQQALVGLNVRHASAKGGAGGLSPRLRDLGARPQVAYTQQDAKELLERNSTEDNATFMRLAERLVQQQDAAISSPAAIYANIPEQGRVFIFKRSVVVDPWADLKIRLQAKTVPVAAWTTRVLMLCGILVILAALTWAARGFGSLTTPKQN